MRIKLDADQVRDTMRGRFLALSVRRKRNTSLLSVFQIILLLQGQKYPKLRCEENSPFSFLFKTTSCVCPRDLHGPGRPGPRAGLGPISIRGTRAMPGLVTIFTAGPGSGLTFF